MATLTGPGPIAVLTYSVGQQIAVAAWAALLSFLALAFVFRTTDWRSLIRSAGREADEHREREQARSSAAKARGARRSSALSPDNGRARASARRLLAARGVVRPASVSSGTRTGSCSRLRRIAAAAASSRPRRWR